MERFKIFVDVMLVLLFVGLITLGISQKKALKKIRSITPKSNQSTVVATKSGENQEKIEPDLSFLEEANLSLQASISGLLTRLELLEETDSKTEDQNTGSVQSTLPATNLSFQTQDIFIGSASTNNTNWTDSGQEVSLFSGHYPSNVNCYFEAGLSIVGGEVWARLKNKTTGAIIPITELSHNSSTVTWKYSNSFNLHSGNNTYVVQLRSTSGEKANLAGARVKISQ
ncbi:MAG: hypothetical protein HOC16_05190 [Candidatus Pacebacteria bacterium]|jgi:hypothetical protein|nr:hypothetical protein [Candidatus Paceibacterota bacterium]MBT4652825.1 hypothetical protein [Candidatus Paceibacterota bacterium]